MNLLHLAQEVVAYELRRFAEAATALTDNPFFVNEYPRFRTSAYGLNLAPLTFAEEVPFHERFKAVYEAYRMLITASFYQLSGSMISESGEQSPELFRLRDTMLEQLVTKLK